MSLFSDRRLPGQQWGMLWSVICISCLFMSQATLASEPVEDLQTLQRTSRAFAHITKQAKPAVVFIKVEKTLKGGPSFEFNDPFDLFSDEFFERFFRRRFPEGRQPREFKQQGQGSGFIISAEGYVLTNHHVVGDADRITVGLADGRELSGKVVGSDPKSDIAVIKIEGEELPVLPLGNSDELEEGEWVIAIGNPFGLSHTVTVGIVSAKGRSVVGIADYEDFIQTDAAINPGNSGGPLINLKGEVVGINTAIFSRSGGYMGIGFAIPINMAKTISQQLIKTGAVVRGYLGITIQALTPELAKSFYVDEGEGILVTDVEKDSPAEQAGLQTGDVIVELNGEKVVGLGPFRNQIALTPPNTQIRLQVVRDGRKRELSVTVGRMPEEIATTGQRSNFMERLGLAVQNLSEELAQQFDYEPGSGVLIAQVEPGSPAASAGLRRGMLIREANRIRVRNISEFQEAVAKNADSSLLLLLVQEGQRHRFVTLRLQ